MSLEEGGRRRFDYTHTEDVATDHVVSAALRCWKRQGRDCRLDLPEGALPW